MLPNGRNNDRADVAWRPAGRSAAIIGEADVRVRVNVTVLTTSLCVSGGLLIAVAPAAAQSYELIEAAKEEGALVTMALADDWCGYGELIRGFETKYGIEVTDLNANASSLEQIAALREDKDRDEKEGPDVVDVTLAAAVEAAEEGLLEPYRVATWDTIPEALKDAEARWTGGYYGVLAFEVNADVVKTLPQDWKDLLGDAYAKSVALAGNPSVSVQGVQGVFAAGLSLAEGDMAKAAEAGLQFFADLNAAGNFLPVAGGSVTLADKTTPIVIRWDYLALRDRDLLKDNTKVEVVIPRTGIVGGAFAQAISAHAPHPNAAKLWLEYLYSDEGQLAWLKAYCHPIRYRDLVESEKVPPEIADSMPPPSAYEAAVFPTVEQQTEAAARISGEWGARVGAQVSR
jgi:putative spermidine/putrescine transport system substrate-binding protein